LVDSDSEGGRYSNYTVGLISSLFGLLVAFLIKFFFTRKRRVFKIIGTPHSTYTTSFHKKKPYFFVGYVLCLIMSTTAAFFTLLWTLYFDKQIPNWIQSTALGMGQDVLVNQPVKIILLVTITFVVPDALVDSIEFLFEQLPCYEFG
jgi:hypothetical protein